SVVALFPLAVASRCHETREWPCEAREFGRDDELGGRRRAELVERVEVLKRHGARVGVHRLRVDGREGERKSLCAEDGGLPRTLGLEDRRLLRAVGDQDRRCL